MRHLAAFILSIAAAVALPASATTIFVADLTGAAESPPNASPGTGTARITFDGNFMRVEASFSGLIGTTAAAHIHCCTTDPLTGIAGVATTTPTFPGFPGGVTSGTYDNTFDMTDASSYNASFITANGGTPASAFAALLAGLSAGRAYFNIHSSQYPGGEIRGFLEEVPEPATAALLGLGLLGVGLARKRKRS
jgi:hypothetical protein